MEGKTVLLRCVRDLAEQEMEMREGWTSIWGELRFVSIPHMTLETGPNYTNRCLNAFKKYCTLMVVRLRVAKTIKLVLVKQCRKIDSQVRELGIPPGIVIFLVRKNNAME